MPTRNVLFPGIAAALQACAFLFVANCALLPLSTGSDSKNSPGASIPIAKIVYKSQKRVLQFDAYVWGIDMASRDYSDDPVQFVFAEGEREVLRTVLDNSLSSDRSLVCEYGGSLGSGEHSRCQIFADLNPGAHTLSVVFRGTVLENRTVEIEEYPTLGGTKKLVVDPSRKATTLLLGNIDATYSYVRDLTHARSIVTWVWTADGQVVGSKNISVGGPKLHESWQPLLAVSKLESASPKDQLLASEGARLFLFENGDKLLAHFKLDSQTLALWRQHSQRQVVATENPSDSEFEMASARAREEYKVFTTGQTPKSERRWGDKEMRTPKRYPEQLVCAIANTKEGRDAYHRMLKQRNVAHWDTYDGLIARDVEIIYRDHLTVGERKKLRERSMRKLGGVVEAKDAEKKYGAELSQYVVREEPGCLQMMLGFADSPSGER